MIYNLWTQSSNNYIRVCTAFTNTMYLKLLVRKKKRYLMINAFIVIVYITLYSSIICFQNCYLPSIQASFLFTTAICINCQGQRATPIETITGIVLDTISVELPLPDVWQTHQGRQQLTQALWLWQLWCYLPLGRFRHRMHVLYKCALVAANKPQSDSNWFILSCLLSRRYWHLFLLLAS